MEQKLVENNEFVLVDYDEERVLLKCWKSLPITLSFEEFCDRIEIHKSKSSDDTYLYSLPSVIGSCVYYIQVAWKVSGYVSTAWTAVKYRRYIFILISHFLL